MQSMRDDVRCPRGYTYAQAKAAAQEAGAEVVPTFCAMCGPSAGCGIYAFVKDGVFTHVAGMSESPVNQGGLCVKGHMAPQWVYSPDRLKTPLLRTGAKGEGKFREITWDEAVGLIADRLLRQKEQYGPESLAILSPARRSYSDYLQRFLIVHGSPNYGHSGICAMQRAFAFCYTLGGMPMCDYQNAELIVLWGRQPVYSGPAMGAIRDLLSAKERGCKIVAVKPSVEPDVGFADLWISLRPGTDAALALSMLHVILHEDLIDAAFVKDWCSGYEELKAHVRQYTPEWGAYITGVPGEQIAAFARMYAGTKAAAVDLGNGVEHMPSSSDAIRAVASLMAVTGHLDRPGCNVFGFAGGRPVMPFSKPVSLPERYTKRLVDKLVGPEFPIPFQPFLEGTSSAYYRILDSVLTKKPYPIRAVIAPGTHPRSRPGHKACYRSLKKSGLLCCCRCYAHRRHEFCGHCAAHRDALRVKSPI